MLDTADKRQSIYQMKLSNLLLKSGIFSIKPTEGIKERYRAILIIDNSHRYISICICKIWYDFDQLKKIRTSENGSFFAKPCILLAKQMLQVHLIVLDK